MEYSLIRALEPQNNAFEIKTDQQYFFSRCSVLTIDCFFV